MTRYAGLPGLAVLLAGLFLLSGCATMSPAECLTADWLQRGYRDGRLGYPAARVIKHRDACAEVGVRPDQERYRKGRNQGIQEYCQPANAVAEGRAGKRYRQVCPPAQESRFLYYYRQGKRAYDARRQVERLESDSRSLEYRLDREDDRKARRRLRWDLRDLDDRLRRARDALMHEERRLQRLEY